MANSHLRCRACRQYFPAEEMFRRDALGAVCSDECRRQLAHNKARERKFHEEPATPSSKIRKRVRLRDGERCRYCGCRTSLQVHHIVYRSEGGPDIETNLITLCDIHHRLMHSDKRRWQPVLLELIRLAYTDGSLPYVPQAERMLEAA